MLTCPQLGVRYSQSHHVLRRTTMESFPQGLCIADLPGPVLFIFLEITQASLAILPRQPSQPCRCTSAVDGAID